MAKVSQSDGPLSPVGCFLSSQGWPSHLETVFIPLKTSFNWTMPLAVTPVLYPYDIQWTYHKYNLVSSDVIPILTTHRERRSIF
ncbi:hypothetical protein TNIN_413021 [Trichonephila inaurata madagascariensis]|uniref:Uncharacterized protein n=1 Tax=Trichonephila inaurata madagascariensis TaxID=2747483 RepID=A0A8X6WYT5_9ARAC|nr:hypothetical protein TNIN_413021 [Trichonephila inaurata madagascariensis]